MTMIRKADKLIDARLGESSLQEEYNGWANYETWNVYLWVGNEEPSYRAMVRARPFTPRSAERFMMDLYPNGTPDMDGPRDYRKVDWQEIADAFNEE